jgi:hypothetical protein
MSRWVLLIETPLADILMHLDSIDLFNENYGTRVIAWADRLVHFFVSCGARCRTRKRNRDKALRSRRALLSARMFLASEGLEEKSAERNQFAVKCFVCRVDSGQLGCLWLVRRVVGARWRSGSLPGVVARTQKSEERNQFVVKCFVCSVYFGGVVPIQLLFPTGGVISKNAEESRF